MLYRFTNMSIIPQNEGKLLQFINKNIKNYRFSIEGDLRHFNFPLDLRYG